MLPTQPFHEPPVLDLPNPGPNCYLIPDLCHLGAECRHMLALWRLAMGWQVTRNHGMGCDQKGRLETCILVGLL